MQQMIQLPWLGEVRAYTLFNNIGTVLGSILLLILLYHAHRSIKQMFQVYLLMGVLVVVGGFLGQFIRGLSYGEFENVSEFFTLFGSGHGIHFIGRVIFAVVLFLPLYRKLFPKMKESGIGDLDYLCLYLVVQHIFNRTACLFNGCCYGRAHSGFGAVQYEWISGEGPGISYSIYPTQLFEIAGMVLLLIVLIVVIKVRKHALLPFGIGFSLVIFLSEFMMDVEGGILICDLTVIQLFALLFAVLTAVIWINNCRKSADINK